MPRPPLSLGQHTRLVAKRSQCPIAADGANLWYTVCRFNDPKYGRIVQVRRFGPTAEAAQAAVQSEINARLAAEIATFPRPECANVGELVDWWWTEVSPTNPVSDATLRNYKFANARFRAEIRSIPITPETLDAVYSEVKSCFSESRTDRLAVTLLSHAVREYHAAWLAAR